jgi:hypothetical protein
VSSYGNSEKPGHSASQAECRRFDPDRPLQSKTLMLMLFPDPAGDAGFPTFPEVFPKSVHSRFFAARCASRSSATLRDLPTAPRE